MGTSTTLYLYDAWNRIAEYAGGTLQRSYTWGMDLSGTMQGAGGVGGLLAVSLHEWTTDVPPVEAIATYYPTFDGNGNIAEYLDDGGVVKAHYEYDPFGNDITPLDDKGELHDLFTYRFSTKPLDSVSGWFYYGYRYYDPLTGRWPSRDPIEENGGVNLYGFVGNNGLSRFDYLGCASFPMPDGWEDFKCCDLVKLIGEIMNAIINRWTDLRTDTNFLYRNPNPPPNSGTWTGHQGMFQNTQRQIRKVLKKFEDKNCQDGLPLGARRWSTVATPQKPLPNPNHPYMTEIDQVPGSGVTPGLVQPQIPAGLWQQASGMAATALGAGAAAGMLTAPVAGAAAAGFSALPVSGPVSAGAAAFAPSFAPAFAN